ncbi:MAG: selenide, water dikinase SelD [bacterium]
MSPGDLSHIIDKLPTATSADLLVGYETADDAGVYRLDSERALVITADFITPVVDDPFTFGGVAAANSLSDVYAMGGRPILAINLCGYPQAEISAEVVGEILAGAAEKCHEAGCVVAGGHSVRDAEVKFGLAVNGLVHPEQILRNSTARAGDRLVLTKPLGTGALIAAHRQGKLPPESDGYRALVATMTALNHAGTILHAAGAHAATDVTGFGLTGHALEMARAADVTFTIDTSSLPLLPDAIHLCATGFTCGGTKANDTYTENACSFADTLVAGTLGLLNDPQTSGGLLVAVPPEQCTRLVAALLDDDALCAEVIGEVIPHAAGRPYLQFI